MNDTLPIKDFKNSKNSYSESINALCKKLKTFEFEHKTDLKFLKNYDLKILNKLKAMHLKNNVQLKNYFLTKSSQIFFNYLIEYNFENSILFLLNEKIYTIFENKNISSKISLPPFHKACSLSYNPLFVEVLINYGFDVNSSFEFRTPIDTVLVSSNILEQFSVHFLNLKTKTPPLLEILEILLKYGAKIKKDNIKYAKLLKNNDFFDLLNSHQISKENKTLNRKIAKPIESNNFHSDNIKATNSKKQSQKNIKPLKTKAFI